MKITMKFEGGAEIAAALDSLPRRVSRSVKLDALMDGGELIRTRAASLAPREPGAPDLADNILIAPRRSGVSNEVWVGIGVPKWAFYDWFSEYGTVNQGPRPFWRPGFDTEAPRAVGVIKAVFWTALAAKGISQSGTAPSPVSGPGSSLA